MTKTKRLETESESAKPDLAVPGFSIPMGDPYINGVVRNYVAAGGRVDAASRPFILRADDPKALLALENYLLRANGSGDTARTEAASQAVAEFKEFG